MGQGIYMRCLVVILGVALGLLAARTGAAEEFGWRDKDGKVVENTDNMKSVEGFGGWLVVTPDPDWADKWNTPGVTPHFSEASQARNGETLTILIFFANAKASKTGSIEVLCDIRVTRPDGSQSVDAKDADCARGALQSDPMNIQLAGPVIKFVGEESDPRGAWIVEVHVKDQVRGIVVPLTTRFVLQ